MFAYLCPGQGEAVKQKGAITAASLSLANLRAHYGAKLRPVAATVGIGQSYGVIYENLVGNQSGSD